jgi:hypothetical protein
MKHQANFVLVRREQKPHGSLSLAAVMQLITIKKMQGYVGPINGVQGIYLELKEEFMINSRCGMFALVGQEGDLMYAVTRNGRILDEPEMRELKRIGKRIEDGELSPLKS